MHEKGQHSTRKETCVAAFLLALGLMNLTGAMLTIPALKGIGAASGASPAPKVFSAVRGLETYSTRFFIEWTDQSGTEHTLELTPEINARLRGPYNRRNIYGAALAYGPILASHERTRDMFDQVMHYAFCGDAPLLKELGINPQPAVGAFRLRLQPKAGAKPEPDLQLSFEVSCDE